jgi:N-acetylneuraminate lyase
MLESPTLTHGLIAAPPTPFGPDGSLHFEAMDRLAEHLVSDGVLGAFVCGTTGEGQALTLVERLQSARRWCEAAQGKLRIIVHVGANCQRDAIALADGARRAGAHAVAAMAPSFLRPAGVDELIDFLCPVAAAAGDLPFYYYHIPIFTGLELPIEQILERALERIPTLGGFKFTNSNLMEYQQCLRLGGGRMDALFGIDEMLLGALAVGAQGAVGSTYTFAASIYRALHEAFFRGDLAGAQALAAEGVTLAGILGKFGWLRAGKAVLGFAGIDCGPPRSPLRPLSPEETDGLRRRLEEAGLAERLRFHARPSRGATQGGDR